MTEPFVAEIRIFPFNFAPTGWAFCDGQLLPISQDTALFSLVGTTFTEAMGNLILPCLTCKGRAPLMFLQGPGLSNYDIGESGGEASVTLTQNQMPAHGHTVQASSGSGTLSSPANADWANAKVLRQGTNLYTPGESNTTMSTQALSSTGGSLPHNNMPPYLALNFCIALQGVFPSRG